MKEKRREEILDAFERCIARHGVAGTGLDLVAQEAGLARALIRHNVGNRDDVLAAAVSRFCERTVTEWQDTLDGLPKRRRYHTLVKWLFDPALSNPHLALVADALITAGINDRGLSTEIRGWLNAFNDMLAQDMRDHVAGLNTDTAAAAATGIISLYFSYDTMTPLGDLEHYRLASARAALMLVEHLQAA